MENNSVRRNRRRGVLCAVLGGVFWGGSGVAGQYLLQQAGFTTEWLVTARLVLAGIILLALDAVQHGGDVLRVWQDRRNAWELLFFGVCGMMGVSYSYFASIRYGNAAAATVLQYLMPAMIVLYVAVRGRKWPSGLEVFCVLLALFGTFLLVTHGDWHALVIPLPAFLWGLVSAVTGAIYTLAPKRLIRAWRAPLIVGWGMLIGGIAMAAVSRPALLCGEWTGTSLLAFLYLILFGSVAAFTLYLGSTKYIAPSEAGVLASVEPLTAIVLSVALLGASFGLLDVLGSASILATVVLLARQ